MTLLDKRMVTDEIVWTWSVWCTQKNDSSRHGPFSLSQKVHSRFLPGNALCRGNSYSHHCRLVLPFLELRNNGTMWDVCFYVWLLLYIMFVRFFHVVVCIGSLFIFIAEWYFIQRNTSVFSFFILLLMGIWVISSVCYDKSSYDFLGT